MGLKNKSLDLKSISSNALNRQLAEKQRIRFQEKLVMHGKRLNSLENLLKMPLTSRAAVIISDE